MTSVPLPVRGRFFPRATRAATPAAAPVAGRAATLDAVAPGSRAVVTAVTATSARRLAELGLRPGVTVRVLTRNAGGGVTLALGTSRLAVDRGVLRTVAVTAA